MKTLTGPSKKCIARKSRKGRMAFCGKPTRNSDLCRGHEARLGRVSFTIGGDQ